MKWICLVLAIVLLATSLKASPYNKYGRTCKDILCIAGQEECVMAHDSCDGYTTACGNYPTCKRKAGTPKQGCASIKCERGQFCSIRQENCSRPPCEIKPVCIAFRTTATSSSSTSVAGLLEAFPTRPPTPSTTSTSIFKFFQQALQKIFLLVAVWSVRRPSQSYDSTRSSFSQQSGYNQRASGGYNQGNTGQRTSWSWSSG